MAYEKYTIRQFYNALYKQDRSIIRTNDELSVVNSEYINQSGLYDEEEFHRTASIYYLNNRINSIKLAIRLQKDFLKEFDVPFLKELKFFKKFGHSIQWRGDREDFLKRLKTIEEREAKYEDELEAKIKELKTKRHKKENPQFQSNESFIRTVNTLNKIGFKVEWNDTTVEEFSIMIKQQTEENKANASR